MLYSEFDLTYKVLYIFVALYLNTPLVCLQYLLAATQICIL